MGLGKDHELGYFDVNHFWGFFSAKKKRKIPHMELTGVGFTMLKIPLAMSEKMVNLVLLRGAGLNLSYLF